MTYEEVLNYLAPCGLSCHKCFAFVEGQIGECSQALQRRLGNFDIYAKRFSAFIPEFNDYPSFKRLLTYLAKPDCMGCRKGTCKYPNCGVAACYKEKRIDFCYQCKDFPCAKTNFDPHLERRWIAMNRKMEKIGVVAYFEETRDLCRYL